MLHALRNPAALLPQRGIMLIFAFVLVITVDAFAFDVEKLKTDLAAYRSDLTAITRDAGDPGQLQPLFVMYLADNQATAASTQDFLGQNRSELPIVKELEKFNKKRIQSKDRVLLVVTSTTRDWPFLAKENQSWMKHLYPYLEDVYVKKLVVRKRLYEYKYFEDDDPKQANALEGWLNGALPFTKFRDEEAWYRQSGVSSWEATTRVEPLVLLENNNHPGVLATVGMLYNFFPEVSAAPAEKFQTQIKTDIWSKHLKRTGLKLGVGALFDDPKTELLTGVGLQMRVWSLWGVYSPGLSRFSLAVSLSEWDWLKKVLPFFQ